MAWKDGTKIAKFGGQVQLRKELQRSASSIRRGWMNNEDAADELVNIILDYWGAMGPDCMTMQE